MRAGRQAGNRPSEPSEQASRPAGKQASRKAGKQASTQAGRQAGMPAGKLLAASVIDTQELEPEKMLVSKN